VLYCALFGPTPVALALERVEEVGNLVKGNRRLDVFMLAMGAWLEAMRGQFDDARQLVTDARELAEEVGLETELAATVLLVAGDVELLAGDAAAAERALRPACETLERIGDLGHLYSVVPILADALYAQGRGGEAAPWIERASRSGLADDADGQVGWRRVRAKLLASLGEIEEAERLAREATTLAARTDFLDLCARAWVDLAEVLRLAGRPEEAAAALREAIRLYEEKGNIVAARTLRSLLDEPPIKV
jgi:tetratricopeptide (TPR) repeat protein